MDRGIPTEEVLAQMRAADPPVHYLVGTPKGRLSRLEQALLEEPWHAARPGVQVKLLAQDEELYVLCAHAGRTTKNPATRAGLQGLARALLHPLTLVILGRAVASAPRLVPGDVVSRDRGELEQEEPSR
jgi:hypothetical protein